VAFDRVEFLGFSRTRTAKSNWLKGVAEGEGGGTVIGICLRVVLC